MMFQAEEEVPEIATSSVAPDKVPVTRKIDGIYHLAGEGPKTAQVMFIAASALSEETASEQKLRYGKPLKQKPSFMKGPAGSIFKDLAAKCGLSQESYFYTAICRWLLPRARRLRPKKPDIEHGMPALYHEINAIKPKIIVCLGKPVFEQFVKDVKGSVSDLSGGWFYNEDLKAKVYIMEDVTKLVTKPEFVERFRVDMIEVKKMLNSINGIEVDKVETTYTTITNPEELKELVVMLKSLNAKVLSVDCEWHGRNHVNGQLRSLQICWADGKACYIRFMDEDMNPVEKVFGCSYKEAGKILSEWLDSPEVKYIGHHLAADLPWLHYTLGLEWYNKGLFDTEFAQQCVDEYEPLGLERMSMKYTDLGRYDLPLWLWFKDKKNKEKAEGGYGRIPDSLIIPYGCCDVDVVFRAWPKIQKQMDAQPGLSEYYHKILNPFISNFFTSYALQGLPMNIGRMDELRELYNWAHREMLIEFQVLMVADAERSLLKKLSDFGVDGIVAYSEIKSFVDGGDIEQAREVFKQTVGVANLKKYEPWFLHYLAAPNFNINSADQIRVWLFDIKGYVPIKSTKTADMPSISWEKVLNYDEKKQAEFKPSADGQTLEILKSQHSDPLLQHLLNVKAVGTVCKNLLKGALTDDDGNVLKEFGLHSWLAEDDRIHGQMSTTETGRPRSWQPNILNWASWVNAKIADGIKSIVTIRQKQGQLPPQLERYMTEKIPSIRSCVESPPGWSIVESDYQTAELRGQAWYAACDDMMDLISLPDKNFVKVRPELMVDEDCVVRVGYPEYISASERSDEWLGAYGVDGAALKRFTEEDYLKDKEGNWVHSKQDLHWSLAEMVHHKPRETLHKKRDRGAAKVGNFSCLPYNAVIATDCGPIQLTNINVLHLLWDGVEHVNHDGITYKGISPCIEYDELTATPDHVVWTTGGTMPLLQAAKEGWRLIQPRRQRKELQRSESKHSEITLPRHDAEMLSRYARIQSQLQRARNKSTLQVSKRVCSVGAGEVAGRGVQEQGSGSNRQRRRLLKGKPSPGNTQREPEEHTHIEVFSGNSSNRVFRAAPRSNFHREDYLEHASARSEYICDTEKIQEIWTNYCQAETQRRSYTGSSDYEGSIPGYSLQTETDSGVHQSRYDSDTNTGTSAEEGDARPENRSSWGYLFDRYYEQTDKEGFDGRGYIEALESAGLKPRLMPVYDIVNAGPRHRFVADGYLVHNSAYGASPNTLERKIESDTGIKPEEGTGQAILDALEARQPRATAFLKSMEDVPARGTYQALSGRIRHFYTHPESLSGMSARTRDGQLSAMGREARNFP